LTHKRHDGSEFLQRTLLRRPYSTCSGAGITIGTEAVVKAPPDGGIRSYLSAQRPQPAQRFMTGDLICDIAPVAAISREPERPRDAQDAINGITHIVDRADLAD
jgi:hypothetical protein